MSGFACPPAYVQTVKLTPSDPAQLDLFGQSTAVSDGRVIVGAYLADETQKSDPRANPLLADMHLMPPMYIVTGGLDALTDDSRRLEQMLKESGVEVEHQHYPGMIHGFFSMALFLDVGQKAVTKAAAALRKTLTAGTTEE